MRIPSITTEKPLIKDEEGLIASSYKEICTADLPLYCPTHDQSLWDAHPRVYLPIEQNGKAICPYCSTVYELRDIKLEAR